MLLDIHPSGRPTPRIDQRRAFVGTVAAGAAALAGSVFGDFGAVRNLDWHYFQNVRGKPPGKGPCLDNRQEDPLHARNVLRNFPDVARHLRGKLEKRLRIEIPPLRV